MLRDEQRDELGRKQKSVLLQPLIEVAGQAAAFFSSPLGSAVFPRKLSVVRPSTNSALAAVTQVALVISPPKQPALSCQKSCLKIW